MDTAVQKMTTEPVVRSKERPSGFRPKRFYKRAGDEGVSAVVLKIENISNHTIVCLDADDGVRYTLSAEELVDYLLNGAVIISAGRYCWPLSVIPVTEPDYVAYATLRYAVGEEVVTSAVTSGLQASVVTVATAYSEENLDR